LLAKPASAALAGTADRRLSLPFMEDAMKDQTAKEARRVVEGGEADRQSQRQGDNRTPDKTIGQVKYADNEGGGEQTKPTGLDPYPTGT
jgi:hypothetical protein